ncbi:MAG: glycosyltransferase family 2 protein [Candidatus Komeilibacteria bacterium]|nr:glycosyltransferase family 2 protein [Candidatus Komeilibacteria bacterium]
MKLSVIIPAFNEEERLPDTLNQVFGYLDKSGLSGETEVLVIDDGSIDNTAAIVRARQEKNLKLIGTGRNFGKGAAVRTGVRQARGEAVLFLDADYSTALEELEKFLPKLEQGYDLVIGSRAIRGARVLVSQNLIKIWLGKTGNLGVRLILGLKVNDSQCGFKLFSTKAKKIFQEQTINGWGFDFELLYLAKKRGLIVLELPVTWVNNKQSKVKPLDYFKTLGELFKIKFNDLRGIYEKK